MSFKRFFIIILFFSCFGCGNEQVRIVGGDGKRTRLNTIVPEFNQQQLEKQKQAMSEYGAISDFRQDYNTKPINSVNLNVTQQDALIPGNYPDYIFADRINSYNGANDFDDSNSSLDIAEPISSTTLSAKNTSSKSKKINKITEVSSKDLYAKKNGLKYKLILNNKVSNFEDTTANGADNLNKQAFAVPNKTVARSDNTVLTKNNTVKKDDGKNKINVVKELTSNTNYKIDSSVKTVKNIKVTDGIDAKVSAVLNPNAIVAVDIKDDNYNGARNKVIKTQNNASINEAKPLTVKPLTVNNNVDINRNVVEVKSNEVKNKVNYNQSDNTVKPSNLNLNNESSKKVIAMPQNNASVNEAKPLTVKPLTVNNNVDTNRNVVDNSIKPSNLNVNNKPSKKISANSSDGYYIQLGIYSDKKNADNVCEQYSKIGTCSMELYNKNYKVVLGPYTDKSIAERDLEKVIKTGHFDVYITNKK